MTPSAWTALKLRMLDAAEIIDAHRAWPKAFIVCLFVMTWKVMVWRITLDKATMEDTAFASIVFAAMAKAFDWYTQGGRTWGSK